MKKILSLFASAVLAVVVFTASAGAVNCTGTSPAASGNTLQKFTAQCDKMGIQNCMTSRFQLKNLGSFCLNPASNAQETENYLDTLCKKAGFENCLSVLRGKNDSKNCTGSQCDKNDSKNCTGSQCDKNDSKNCTGSQCDKPGTDTDTNSPEKNPDVNEPDPSETTPATPAPDNSVTAYEAEVIRLVNEIRVENNLKPFQTNQDLSRVARYKSQDMHDKQYFSHTSPTYGSPFDMMRSFGISYRTAGENIAMGYATPEAVVNAWMNSSGHRKNILNADFTQIGVGYVSSGHYWTQMFIG